MISQWLNKGRSAARAVHARIGFFVNDADGPEIENVRDLTAGIRGYVATGYLRFRSDRPPRTAAYLRECTTDCDVVPANTLGEVINIKSTAPLL